MLLDLGPGDEVIMPSFTFVSTANAFVLRGAVPMFVDIRPDTSTSMRPSLNRRSRRALRLLRSFTMAEFAPKWTPLKQSRGNTV